MMIYFSLALFLMIFIVANIMYYYSSKKYIIFVVVFIVAVLVIFTRSYTQPDFYNYKLIYESINVNGDVLNYITTIEIGFLVLLKFFGFLGIDYFQVSNIIFFLICGLFGFAAYQHRDLKKGEAFLFLLLVFSSYYFYFLSLNVIRQGLAVAMFTIGLSMLFSNRRCYGLFFLIAAFFHYSVVLLILLVVVSKFLKKKLSVSACFILVVFSFFLGFFDVFSNFPFPDIFANRIKKLKYYSDSNITSYAKLVFYSLICFFYYVFIIFRKKFSCDVFFLSSAFLSFSFLFMHYGELLDRFMMYSVAFIVFIGIDIYRALKQNLVGDIVLLLYCLLSYSLVFISPSLDGFFL